MLPIEPAHAPLLGFLSWNLDSSFQARYWVGILSAEGKLGFIPQLIFAQEENGKCIEANFVVRVYLLPIATFLPAS